MVARFPDNIILASSSPRRKQLLADLGCEFTVVPPDIDESAFHTEGITPCEFTELAALAKAKKVAAEFSDFFVIGADTVVDFNGQIIGKPVDERDAERIIRKLFSSPHKVITAVAIIKADAGIEVIESETTTVYPKKMNDSQIAEHIKSQSWRGKAGAYAIQQKGDKFIERIEGSLTNVMGLPTELITQLLNRFTC